MPPDLTALDWLSTAVVLAALAAERPAQQAAQLAHAAAVDRRCVVKLGRNG